MSFELVHADPQKLHEYWPMVRSGLTTCLRHDCDHPLPEDVYTAIRVGQASLYIGQENGRPVGWVVLNQAVNPYNGKVRLNIWLLYAHGAREGLLEQGLAQIEELAEQMGATQITFRPDTLAFARWAKKLDFQLREIELVKEI